MGPAESPPPPAAWLLGVPTWTAPDAHGSHCTPEGTLGYCMGAQEAVSTKRRRKFGLSTAYKTIGTFLSQRREGKMPADSPLSRQRAVVVQWYVSDHRYATAPRSICQLTTEFVDDWNCRCPLPQGLMPQADMYGRVQQGSKKLENLKIMAPIGADGCAGSCVWHVPRGVCLTGPNRRVLHPSVQAKKNSITRGW